MKTIENSVFPGTAILENYDYLIAGVIIGINCGQKLFMEPSLWESKIFHFVKYAAMLDVAVSQRSISSLSALPRKSF